MIYHLSTEKDWEAAMTRGTYKSPSLVTEGFIHCSTAAQLMESARRHFEGYDRLVVLHIVEKRIKELLKWEPARNGEPFPHIYGPIPLEAIESLQLLERNAEGEWQVDE